MADVGPTTSACKLCGHRIGCEYSDPNPAPPMTHPPQQKSQTIINIQHFNIYINITLPNFSLSLVFMFSSASLSLSNFSLSSIAQLGFVVLRVISFAAVNYYYIIHKDEK